MRACKFDLAERGAAIIAIPIPVIALFAAAAIGDGVAADGEAAIGTAGIGTRIGVTGTGIALFARIHIAVSTANSQHFASARGAAAIAGERVPIVALFALPRIFGAIAAGGVLAAQSACIRSDIAVKCALIALLWRLYRAVAAGERNFVEAPGAAAITIGSIPIVALLAALNESIAALCRARSAASTAALQRARCAAAIIIDRVSIIAFFTAVD